MSASPMLLRVTECFAEAETRFVVIIVFGEHVLPGQKIAALVRDQPFEKTVNMLGVQNDELRVPDGIIAGGDVVPGLQIDKAGAAKADGEQERKKQQRPKVDVFH